MTWSTSSRKRCPGTSGTCLWPSVTDGCPGKGLGALGTWPDSLDRGGLGGFQSSSYWRVNPSIWGSCQHVVGGVSVKTCSRLQGRMMEQALPGEVMGRARRGPVFCRTRVCTATHACALTHTCAYHTWRVRKVGVWLPEPVHDTPQVTVPLGYASPAPCPLPSSQTHFYIQSHSGFQILVSDSAP